MAGCVECMELRERVEALRVKNAALEAEVSEWREAFSTYGQCLDIRLRGITSRMQSIEARSRGFDSCVRG